MNTYSVIDSEKRMVRIKAETIARDGDWILLQRGVPHMESRTINHPEQPGTADKPYQAARTETVMVSTGRIAQQPIAMFYKPISVELYEEPSDGDNA